MLPTIDLHEFLENYLMSRDVPFSIIQIDESNKQAFVALDPLWKNVSVTKYFPESLLTYKIELTNLNRRLNDKRDCIPDIYSPTGKLIYRPSWRTTE